MSALVSVIIPVYNAEKYIKNCLESVINQTYKNTEILCIDDGSKDNSGAVIKELAENHKNIKYIFQQNAGVSAARNKGLSSANGDYIVFLDSDDYIHPQAIELMLDCQSKSGADIVCCNYKTTHKTDESFSEINDYNFVTPDLDFLFNCGGRVGRCVWGKLIKSDIAKKHKFPPGLRLGEDLYYMISMLEKQPKTAFIEKEMWYYFSSDDSLTHTAESETELDMLRWFDGLCTELRKSDCNFLKDYTIETIYKSVLRLRSRSVGLENQKVFHKECKKYGRKWLGSLLVCRTLGFKKKMMYTAFYFSRLLYERIFIMHDPTMKDYYHNLRK